MADGLKNVRDQMDAVIDRQKSLSGRILGGGRVGGSGGGSGGSRGNSGGGHGRSENGLFEGLRGNIFLLGEIGDPAREFWRGPVRWRGASSARRDGWIGEDISPPSLCEFGLTFAAVEEGLIHVGQESFGLHSLAIRLGPNPWQ